MPIGWIFWMLMILWAVFGVFWNYPAGGINRTSFAPFGGSVLLFILLFLLGWHEFGFVIQGGR